VTIDTVKIIQDKRESRKGGDGSPLVTPEVVLVAPIPLISTGTDANVEILGVSKNVLEIRRNIKIVEGRMFTPGLNEIVWVRMQRLLFRAALGNTIDWAACTGRLSVFSMPAAAF